MRSAVLALVAACSGTSSSSSTPSAPVVGPPPVAAVDAGIATADASQDEILAAIQKAMNELDEGVQGCWAAAATERFDIEGEHVAQIDIAGPGQAIVQLAKDTARSPRLSTCVIAVLTNYGWAPPLYGQSIQLPFRFRSPGGQNVIDRRLVDAKGQGKLSVAVLLDDANTGNDAASMFELAIASGGTTGMRQVERTEVWYFLGPATVSAVGGKPTTVAAGDMMTVAKSGAREVRAADNDVRAMIVVLPGGREGTARAGALPTPEVTNPRKAPASPVIVPAAKAPTFGPATVYFDQDKTFSASVLTLAGGATVPEHVHATETELLYILEGSGTMTVNGVAVAIAPTSVVQVPPGTKHAFTASTTVRAVQVYTPAGPEQRFKKAATK